MPDNSEMVVATEESTQKTLSFLDELCKPENTSTDKEIALDWFIDVIIKHPEIKKIQKKDLFEKYEKVLKNWKKASKEERDFFTYNGKMVNLQPSYLTDTAIMDRLKSKKSKAFKVINHCRKGWEFVRDVQLSTSV